MKGDELVNPPWNYDNLDEWLYRPVKISGRAIHSHEMKFEFARGEFRGSFVFVPVVTREDKDKTNQSREGLIVGLGWIPHQFDHIWNRGNWENSWTSQDFVGIVTTNEELQNRGTDANIYDEQLFEVSRSFELK